MRVAERGRFCAVPELWLAKGRSNSLPANRLGFGAWDLVPAHSPHPCSSSPEPPGAEDLQQETLDADMGSPLVLTCAVTGVPAVTWLKDGRPLGMHGGDAVPGFCPV